jgi:hypothetical protein
MLLRITNRCMGECPHCMIDGSGPDGDHMTMDVFERALEFIGRSGVRVLLVSGGEPFEHPQVFEMAERLREIALERVLFPAFASNGHFALDEEKLERVRATGIGVQVTCDPRFYQRILLRERFQGDQFTYEDRLRVIFPCRRTQENNIVTTKNYPNCFNIRSVTRQMGFRQGAFLLELKGRVCTPSINIDGTIVAGEADTCHPIGTVDSDLKEVEENLKIMRCDQCGLNVNLSRKYLEAIGAV